MARSRLSFDEFRARSAPQMQGGAAAAGNASVAETFSALRAGAPDYGRMGQNAVAAAGAVERGMDDANTAALNQKIASEASAYIAKTQSEAAVDAAKDQAESSAMGSVVRAGAGLLGAVLTGGLA